MCLFFVLAHSSGSPVYPLLPCAQKLHTTGRDDGVCGQLPLDDLADAIR